MRWAIKRELWHEPTRQARYKKHLLIAEVYSKSGYYFLVQNKENGKVYNSLWREQWFVNLEEAKQAAVDYVDAKLMNEDVSKNA
jgi:hypothetical protein